MIVSRRKKRSNHLKTQNEHDFTLGDKVRYMRIQPGQNGEPDAVVEGEGMIVGKFIDPINRLKVHVRDRHAKDKQAYSVEPYCINPTEAEKIEYYAHQQKINDTAARLNAEVDRVRLEMVAAGNAEVATLNNAMFGPPLAVDDGSDTVH